MNGVILLVAVQCVTAQAVAPREYPHGREPYYYGSENSPWYDSYGRLRYGPQGIPAQEYEQRQKWQTRRLGEELHRQAPPPPLPAPQERGIEPGYPPPAP